MQNAIKELKKDESDGVISPVLISKNEVDKQAEENRAKRELPRKPGDVVSFKELLDWLALLTPDMTDGNRVVLYIYRIEPVIIRQMANPDLDNNIDIVYDFAGFDEEYFVARHGGGKYSITVKDLDKPKTQKGGYFQAKLLIPISQHSPKINDLREVDWDNKNNKGYRAWCKAQGLIDERGMPVELKPKDNNNSQAAGSQDAMVSAMKLMLDFTKSMKEGEQNELKRKLGGEDAIGKTMGDIFIERMRQDDPNKQLTAITSIMTAIKGMQPEAKQDNTVATIMPMFMQMMQAQSDAANKQFLLLMEVMKTKNDSGGKSPITDMKEMFTLFQEMSGGGGSGKKSTAEVIGGIVENNLTPVLNIVGSIIAMKAAQATGGKPAPIIPVTGEPVVAQQTQPQTQPETAMIQPNEAVAVISQFKGIILNKLAGEGWEFGAWIAEGFGDLTAASIAKYGVEPLLAAAKQVPDFWKQIQDSYGEEHLRKWLTSFVNYKEEIARLDTEGETQE